MDLLPLVRGLKLGSDVAEQDSQLSKYFVRTATYLDLIDDEIDVILGPKGSGKSALSRALVDTSSPKPGELDDVEIVAAFNLQGSSIFRRLSTEVQQADEGTMRTAWTVYILALIGNHIVDNLEWNGYVSDVFDRLNDLGLRYDGDRPKSVWSSVITFIRRIRLSKVETSLTASTPGLSGTASAQFEVDGKDAVAVDWESLLELEVEALTSHGRRCWVVFDRLDEAFPHNRELEKAALRGLLHTHRDICSYGSTVKSKLFLRTDLMDRITADQGFVNATHLRMHHIVWDRPSIVNFVARRLLGSSEAATRFGIDEQSLRTERGRDEAFETLLPKDMGGNFEMLRWLTTYTTDASREPNPRNILTLLREARTKQLEMCQRESLSFEGAGSILTRYAIRGGFRELSRKRCQDTLFAEFEELRPWLDAMSGRPFTYTPAQFASTMGYQDVSELIVIIEELKYAGVFVQAPSGQLTVPLLYRNGLNLQDRGDAGSSSGRRSRDRH